MEPISVGIREFRENLATYLLESESPVAITRHGETIGYYIPAHRRRSETERTALKQAAARLDALLAAKGITEEEIVADFNRLIRSGRSHPEIGVAPSCRTGSPRRRPVASPSASLRRE